MATPIIILGMQRSGTTWLGNLISSHSRVAGVVEASHTGIWESAYFSHMADRFGDISTKVTFEEFVAVFGASYYCRCAGITKEFLLGLYPATYEEVFRAVMEEVARRAGADFWVVKEHTACINRMAKAYPDARFIAIVRSAEGMIGSAYEPRRMESYRLTPGQRRWRMVRTVAKWSYHKKVLEHFAASSDRCRLITYEALKEDTEKVLRGMCESLGIDYEPGMIETTNSYRRNTSFWGKQSRAEAFPERDRRLVRRAAALFRMVPRPILALADWWVRRGEQHRLVLPRWYFNPTPYMQPRGQEQETRSAPS